MGTINKNTAISPVLSDLVPVWQSANSDTRRTSFNEILTLMQNNIELPGAIEMDTQYSAPSVTGFNILVNDNARDTHLILTPSTGFANGTITLPANTSVRDKQYFVMNTTEQIATLTVDLNGAAGAHGIPSAMGPDDYMTLKYDLTMNTWYRIG